METGYGDYSAIWLSDIEEVAEGFSEWKGLGEDDIKIVFRVNLEVDKIADISYETSQEIIEFYGLDDFRESIDILDNEGFNGWILPGSLDYISYNDVAIFDEDYIEIKEVKIFIDDDWTDFMSIEKAQQILDNK